MVWVSGVFSHPTKSTGQVTARFIGFEHFFSTPSLSSSLPSGRLVASVCWYISWSYRSTGASDQRPRSRDSARAPSSFFLRSWFFFFSHYLFHCSFSSVCSKIGGGLLFFAFLCSGVHVTNRYGCVQLACKCYVIVYNSPQLSSTASLVRAGNINDTLVLLPIILNSS